MPATPRCTECGKALVDENGVPKRAGTKTCSQPCRQKRSRRMASKGKRAAQAREANVPEHHRQVSEIVRGDVPDVAREVMKEELRPVVREAMTEDVLRSVNQLMGLTEKMVLAIELDLDDPDPTVRQKAYTLLARYTLGNPSIAPPPAEQSPVPLQVFFGMPRPGDASPGRADDVVDATADAEETKQCEACGLDKPGAEFVPGADRCQACHDDVLARAAAFYDD